MLGFVVDTARVSSSEGKHRSEFDSGVFSNTEREIVNIQHSLAQKSKPNGREGSPGPSEKNEKSMA